jgi:hypothetical protein
MVSALEFARLCAFREFPEDDVVKALVEDYGMAEDEAREKYRIVVRERQELDITDVHDDMEREHGDRPD